MRLSGAALALVLVAACSSVSKPDPTPLAPYTPSASAQPAWMQTVGEIRGLASAGTQLLVTTSAGELLALEPASGKTVWRARAGAAVSAGGGSDGRLAALVTRDNELVAFDEGKELWRRRLAAGVVTPPLVAGERVFVQGTDRAIAAFDALDGRPLWTYQRQGDPLALAQPGLLFPLGDTLMAGVGPRLVALDPLTGALRAEASVAAPRGTNEVERLADLVAPLSRIGDSLCLRSFQAGVACLEGDKANVVWRRNAGGRVGLAGDATVVVGADASSRLTAWRRSNGDVLWTSEALRHRELGSPALIGPSVAFGDLEGQIHLLALDNGATRLRLATDGKAIAAGPLAFGDLLIVGTGGGAVQAWRIAP